MSFLAPFFEYDAFVCFPHGEPTREAGLPLKDWTLDLIRQLETGIRAVDTEFDDLLIWRDEQIDPTVHLTDELRAKVASSGILFVFMSPRFLASSWCRDEVDWFRQQLAEHQSDIGRVFVIRALPTDEADWPDFLRDDRGQPLIGFTFYDRKNGFPYRWRDTQSAPDEYVRELWRLQTALMKRLRELRANWDRRASQAPPIASEVKSAPRSTARPWLIYLYAQPAFASLRDAVASQLRKAGMEPVWSTGGVGGQNLTDSGQEKSSTRIEVAKRCDAIALLRAEGDDDSFVGELLDVGVDERERIQAGRGNPLPCAILDNSSSSLPIDVTPFGIERFDLKDANWSGKFHGWLEEHSNRSEMPPTQAGSFPAASPDGPALFICCSSKDNIFALAFKQWLETTGSPSQDIFLDLVSLSAGENWRQTVKNAAAGAACIIFLASPDSLSSAYCRAELDMARTRGKDIIVVVLRDLNIADQRLVQLGAKLVVDASAQPRDTAESVSLRGDRHEVRFNSEALARIGEALGSYRVAPGSGSPSVAVTEASRPSEAASVALGASDQSRLAGEDQAAAAAQTAPFAGEGPSEADHSRRVSFRRFAARVREKLGMFRKYAAAGFRYSAGELPALIRQSTRHLPQFRTVAAIALVLAPLLAAWAAEYILARGSFLLVDAASGRSGRAHALESTSITFGNNSGAFSQFPPALSQSLPPSQIITSSYDGTIKFWDLSTGALLHTEMVNAATGRLPAGVTVAPLTFAIGTDGTILAVTEAGLALVDNKGRSVFALFPTTAVQAVAPLGPTVADAIPTPYAVARNWAAGQSNAMPFAALAIPGASNTYAVGTDDGRVALETGAPASVSAPRPQCDLPGGCNGDTVIGQQMPPSGSPKHGGAVTALAVIKDGTIAASVADDGSVILWTLKSGRFVSGVALGESQGAASSTTAPGTAKSSNVCDLCSTAAFSTDGRWLITAGWGGAAQVWDVANKKLIRILQHGAAINVARLSSDGSVAATAGDDGAARLWNVASGKLLAIIRGHAEALTQAEFTPDGSSLVTGARDGAVRVTSISQAEVLNYIDPVRLYRQYSRAAPKVEPPSLPPPPTSSAPKPGTIPIFPWPPPAASATYVLPGDVFKNRNTIGQATSVVLVALESAGYVDRSFFATPAGGVSLVTRLERINDDGSPVTNAQRWPTAGTDQKYNPSFDLGQILRDLFFANTGRYRVIVFILQNEAFSQTEPGISGSTAQAVLQDAQAWIHIGINVLPTELADRTFNGNCTALIYEFLATGSGVQRVESHLTGVQDLRMAGLQALLGGGK